MAASLKETLYTLADQLPDNATWDDVMEKVCFRRAIEISTRVADQGEFATKEEIRAAFARWGVDIAG